MSQPLTTILALLAITMTAAQGDGFMDRLDESLSFSGFNDQVRARISGFQDVEYYQFSGAAPGLIYTDESQLLNSRLALFGDAQLGANIYLFAQGRLDRGFDPSDQPLGVRLDEYALRLTPWEDGRFSLQIGRFATVVGNAVGRHLSWDNPFVTAPLIYENVTAINDSEPPKAAKAFTEGVPSEKYEYNPVIWGPSYASGLSLSGKLGSFDYAAEVKNAGLSSRPESWGLLDRGFEYPTVSTRIGYRPDMAWNLGFSASRGPYFMDDASKALPAGRGLGDYNQIVLGQDIGYSWRHWQLWAEVYQARFEVPHVGNADTLSYYVEAKYKFSPNLYGALRWNQQFFGEIPNGSGGMRPWGDDISRIDIALTYRFTESSQMKFQYSIEHEDGSNHDLSHLFASQFTVRF